MEAAVVHSSEVSDLTRKIWSASIAARARCHQCAVLHTRCVQLDGYVLAWKTGSFKDEFVTCGALAMGELVRVLKRALRLVSDCCSETWLQWALVRHHGEQEFESLVDEMQWCVELVIDRIGSGGLESMRQKALEDGFFTKEALRAAAARDREELIEQLRQQQRADAAAAAAHLVRKLEATREVNEEIEPLLIERGSLQLELGVVLGKGASGKVVRGSWLGHPVAVKVIGAEDPTLNMEIKAMSKLPRPHPNILQIMGYSREGDKQLLVMELMKMDLRKFIDRRRIPLLAAVDIMLQIARGTRHLHEHSVVHRDLKPQNVLVDFEEEEDGCGRAVTVRLTDFGIARTDFDTYLGAKNLTHKRGTIRYMAPEMMAKMAKKSGYSRKVDVYSFGITCSEILTGIPPFGDEWIPMEDLRSMLEVGQRPGIPEDCPGELRKLIHSCWSTDPEQRPKFEEIEKSLVSVKKLLLTAGVNQMSNSLVSSYSTSSSTTMSSPTMPATVSMNHHANPVPKLEDFKIRGNPEVGGKLCVQFKLTSGASYSICRWVREPRNVAAPMERMKPIILSNNFTDLNYTVTAADYDKRLVLECLPMSDELGPGRRVTEFVKGGGYIGCGRALLESIEKDWNNGQARFSVQHLHQKWWESNGRLFINHKDYFLWWGQGNAKNLRYVFAEAGPNEEAPIQACEDGPLLCNLKRNNGSFLTVKFPSAASRDSAVLTMKYFWERLHPG